MPGTITTDQTVIKAAELVSDYLVLGTFASAQALNDDIKVEGTNGINGRVSANTAWSLAAAAAAIDMTPAGTHVWMWLRLLTWPSADTKANGGIGISISSDVTPTLTGTTPNDGPTNSKTWFLAGSNTETTAGWVCYCVDPNGTPDLTLGTPVISSIDRVGLRCKITGAVSNKTLNMHHDVVRYGTGLTVKDGTSGSPAAFVDVFTTDSSNTNAWGVVTRQGGIYFLAGKLKIGTAAQAAVTYFKDTNQVVVWQQFPVAATFYEILLAGAASFGTTFKLGNYTAGLVSDGCTVKGAGDPASSTHAIWTLTADAANQTLLLYGSTFSEMKAALLATTSEIRGCTFNNSGQITAGGGLIDGCTFQNLKTTAPISATYQIRVETATPTLTNNRFVNCATAVLWNRAADPNGKLDKCTFISGGTGHAVELGALTPATINLTDVTFTGYGADGTTDAAIYNNSGAAITINILGTGNAPTVRNGSGASTTIVAGTVTTTITVVALSAGSPPIENARVLVTASDNTGPMPFDETVTITRVDTTATVAHTAHGLINGKKVKIKGANEQAYNGIKTLTLIDANSYSYTVSGTPATPATGTIKATGVVIDGLTNASGVISDTRTHASNQPITGTARKSSGAPNYKPGAVAGTVNSATGFSTTVQLVGDD